MKIAVLGGGITGLTTAYLAASKKHNVTLIEAESMAGGGVYTRFHGGVPFTLGPRIFFTNDSEVINFVESKIRMRKTNIQTISFVAGDQQFYNYPLTEYELSKMPDINKIENEMGNLQEPISDNFEGYWQSRVGTILYHKIFDNYSKKMWGIESNKVLLTEFDWVGKGTTIRKERYRSVYQNYEYQGYPDDIRGYNQLILQMLNEFSMTKHFNTTVTEVDLERKIIYVDSREPYTNFDIIISTIPIDEVLNNCSGSLRYEGRQFIPIVLPVNRVLPHGTNWIHYCGDKITEPQTRVTDMNTITNYSGPNDMLLVELPGPGRYYPVRTRKSVDVYNKYLEIIQQYPWFRSIGRLGGYRYIGIPEAIRIAMDTIEEID